ncbi:hypothetical protein TNCT_408511 [Trichonephila clavata]|uniref:Uncharacterized protein n=1 Tax=Trichonephila clavata TaxID=2740835 RepID=A0A8X6FLT9_TRICU|nr:hypothetical protein TNCT_408511 [Trichonephila clavata]
MVRLASQNDLVRSSWEGTEKKTELPIQAWNSYFDNAGASRSCRFNLTLDTVYCYLPHEVGEWTTHLFHCSDSSRGALKGWGPSKVTS